MKKYRFLLLLILLGNLSFGQWSPADLTTDSIPYSFRTGGALDTVDLVLKRSSSAIPAGGLDFPNGVPTIDFFINYRSGSRVGFNSTVKRLKYSGLPHIGFSYTFGTQGTQVAQMNYQQVFRKNTLINFDLINDRGNGYLRYSNFKMNDISLAISRKGRVWSTRFDLSDKSTEASLNGGILPSSDPSAYPLIFMSVNKQNAISSIRNTSLEWKNYFDFVKDSINSFGVITSHALRINQRHYTEEDTLFGIYNVINFDSLKTNDFYQLSRTDQGAGLFKRSDKLYASAQFVGSYWKYYNMNADHDTLETALITNLVLKTKNWEFDNSNRFNLSGSGNEWSVKAGASGKINNMRLITGILIGEFWPEQYQRFYLANNYNYQLNNYQKQFRFALQNKLKLSLGPVRTEIFQSTVVLNNNYFFSSSNESWKTDLLSELLLNRIGVRAHWNYKALTIQPEYSYTMESGLNDIIPDHMAKMRISVKGKLFKSKKLEAYTGVEGVWFSSANNIAFIPSMDTYVFDQTLSSYNGIVNLHAFGGFQIDEFRFYVRFENIGYFWNDVRTQLMDTYPLPSTQLRIGLTWDFFN